MLYAKPIIQIIGKNLPWLTIHTQKNADTQDQKTVQLGSFSQHPARYLAKKSGETLLQELIECKVCYVNQQRFTVAFMANGKRQIQVENF